MSGNSESASKHITSSPFFSTSESYQASVPPHTSFATSSFQGDQLHQQSSIAAYHSQQMHAETLHNTHYMQQLLLQLAQSSDSNRVHLLELVALVPLSSGQDHSLYQFLISQPQMQSQQNPQHIFYHKEDMAIPSQYSQEIVYSDVHSNLVPGEGQNSNFLYHNQIPPSQASSSSHEISGISNQYEANYVPMVPSNEYSSSSQYGNMSTLPHFVHLQQQSQLPQQMVNWTGQRIHDYSDMHTSHQVSMGISPSQMGSTHRASVPYAGPVTIDATKSWIPKGPPNVSGFTQSDLVIRSSDSRVLSWPLSKRDYQELMEKIKKITNMTINPFLLGLLHSFKFNIPIDDFYNCIYNNDDNSFKFLENGDRKVDLSMVTDLKYAESSIKTIYEVLNLVKKTKTNPASLEGDDARPLNFHELLRNFLAIKILNEMLIEVLDTSDANSAPESTIPRLSIYKTYFIICQLLISRYPSSSNTYQEQQKIVLSQSKVGKLIKLVYPELRIKRLGARGDSKYTYLGVMWNDSLVSASIKEMCNNNELKALFLIHSESDVIDTLITPSKNSQSSSIPNNPSYDPDYKFSGASESLVLKKRKGTQKSLKTPTSQFLDAHYRRPSTTSEGGDKRTASVVDSDQRKLSPKPSFHSPPNSFINTRVKYPQQFESPELSLIGSFKDTDVSEDDSWFSDAKRNIYINYPFLSSSISEIIRNIASQASHESLKEDYLLNYVTSKLLKLYMQKQFGPQQEIRRAHYLKFEMHVFFALVLEFIPYFLSLKVRPSEDQCSRDLVSLTLDEHFVQYLTANVLYLSKNLESRYNDVFILRDGINLMEDGLDDNRTNWKRFLNILRSMLDLNNLLSTFILFSASDRLEMGIDFKQLGKYDANYRNNSLPWVLLDDYQLLDKRETSKSSMFEENMVLHNLLKVLLAFNVKSLLVDVKSIASFFPQYIATYLSGEYFKGRLDKDMTILDNPTSHGSPKSSTDNLSKSGTNRGAFQDAHKSSQIASVSDLLVLVHSKLLTSELKSKYSIFVCNSFFNALYDDMVQYWRFIHVKNARIIRQLNNLLSSEQVDEKTDAGIASDPTRLSYEQTTTDIQKGQFLALDTLSIEPNDIANSLDRVERCWLFLSFLKSYTLLMGEIVGLQSKLQQE